MFQRLSSLFFGEVEHASADLKGPKPCVTEADEEGWLLVNLPAALRSEEWVELAQGRAPAPPCSVPHGGCSGAELRGPSLAGAPATCDRCRTNVGRRRRAVELCSPVCPGGTADGAVLPSPSPPSRGSTPGSQSDCSGGQERCCMDESWFVTPPPCFTAEGATAESSPMEDLLIEHPSMSVYVSPCTLSMVEESTASLAVSVSMMTDPAPPAPVQTSAPRRVTRGAASQAGPLAKVTQMPRLQRAKARCDRRHLSRNRVLRQNRAREQAPPHAGHARGSFLHQPSQRSYRR